MVSEKLKQKVLLMSGNKCCICSTSGIHCHHIIFKEKGGPDTFENLAPLCPNCHTQVHAKCNMILNLTEERIKAFRDDWYQIYQKKRKLLVNLNQVYTNDCLVTSLINFYGFTQRKEMVMAKTNLRSNFRRYVPVKEEKCSIMDVFYYVGSGIKSEEEVEEIFTTLKNCYYKYLEETPNVKKYFIKMLNKYGIDYELI